METAELMGPLFAAPTTRQAADAAPGLFAKAVCLQLTLSRLGTRRKVSTDAVQTDADRDLVHVSAEILQSPELDAVRRADRELQEFVRNRASGPAFLNRGGVHLLALDLVESTDDEITRRLAAREALVAAFLVAYEAQRDATEAKLASLAARVTWPDLARVARSFGASVRYLALDTPASLAGIRRDIFERERTKAAAEWREALDECRQVLRAAFADLIAHLAERLQPGENGKPRTFRDSLVQNFEEFATTFAARNIADDAQLADLVARARGVLAGVSAGDLRKQEGLRAAVARSMAEIKAAVDPLVIDRPTRRYADEE